MTPATTLSARICIRPVLSPFLYFPYVGLTTLLYPILGYLFLLYTQLISFLVSLDYGSYDPCVRLQLPGNGITCWFVSLPTRRSCQYLSTIDGTMEPLAETWQRMPIVHVVQCIADCTCTISKP